MEIKSKIPLGDPKITFGKVTEKKGTYQWGSFFKVFFESWLGKALVFFILPLVIANFWFFWFDDFANGCHIKISPSITEWNNVDIKKAILLMKEKSPKDYQTTCDNVRKIQPELACGGMGGGCFHSNTPDEITVSTSFRPKENHAETTVAIMVHEVCHLLQNKENRGIEEGECYEKYCRVLYTMGVREGYDDRCVMGHFGGNIQGGGYKKLEN